MMHRLNSMEFAAPPAFANSENGVVADPCTALRIICNCEIPSGAFARKLEVCGLVTVLSFTWLRLTVTLVLRSHLLR